MAIRLPSHKFLGVRGGYFKDKQVVMPRPNVKIIGNTSNMKEDVWQRTRVLLMPSDYESYGMVGVEALASGIPVIAARTPGLVESLGDGGIFVDGFSIQAWKNAITKLDNPRLYQEASQRALRRSLEIDPRKELKQFMGKIEDIV